MTVLTNLNIWDGEGALIREDVDTLEIADGKIVRTCLASDLPDSERKESRDLGGLFIMPGMIDAHVHMCLNPEIMNPMDQDKVPRDVILNQIETRAQAMLAAGITTARDLGGGQWLELEVRDRIRRKEVSGPRLICSGQPVTSVMGHCHFWGGEASDLAAALAVVARQVDHDVDLIKVMATGGNLTKGSKPADAQFDTVTLRAIVTEARRNGFHVAAHCHGTTGIGRAAEAGVTTIEHCSWVGGDGWAKNYDADVCAEIVRQGAFVSPTINLGWKRRIGSGDYEALVLGNYANMKAAGVRFIASTDAGIPNVFHHDLPRALPVFAHFAGLSNAEVLRAATSDCAVAIGLGEVTGRIGAGLSADLVLFDGNPLIDLDILVNPVDVIARGRSLREVAL
ncbi:MAG: amidohydrolase family protein [Pseudomonadales bacterium]